MKILVDENIPLARELFGPLGDMTLVSGRDVDEGFPGLEQFDVLAIRSVTKVTPALVDRAVSVKVIATATIGTDHIDLAYIGEANWRRENAVTVLAAPGSNAESVADYVWYALGRLTRDAAAPLSEMSLGIVGHGNCGSRVARRAEGFGMRVLRCDPPLAERDARFVSDAPAEALAADFVTLHVPLTHASESRYPTHYMIGAEQLAQMKRSAYLLNSSRGAVVDSDALISALTRGTIAGAVLDVYEGEPHPPPELIGLPVLSTPHIAGYAIEAKRRGAVVIYEGICRALGIEPRDTGALLMRGFRPPSAVRVEFGRRASSAATADAAVRSLMARIHDIGATSDELKATLSSDRPGELFDAMRRNYERDHGRHELALYRVGFDDSVGSGLRAEIGRRAAGFGIQVADRDPHYVLSAA